MSKYRCSICNFIFDESTGYPPANILPGTCWSDIPESFVCPLCGAAKTEFILEDESDNKSTATTSLNSPVPLPGEINYTEGELSAIFSNLAKGAEKQYNTELSGLYNDLAAYYAAHPPKNNDASFDNLTALLKEDIASTFGMANNVASQNNDRGALRALKWSEGVSRMTNAHLNKVVAGYAGFLKDTNIYVCEICGFIHIGDEKPGVCPVCKVPNLKITQIKKGA